MLVFGDMPIFVSHDSADVWAGRDLFLLDESGSPTTVTGVPPDYFAAEGQMWNNPHYDWDRMAEDDFAWWRRRVAAQREVFDLVRIDHFRGFEAAWHVPADAPNAIEGEWVSTPGREVLAALVDTAGVGRLVAEDLGTITPEVEALRQEFEMPGMKILQFAFGGDPDNPYLPQRHGEQSVVYTGTHDNDTTLGWWHSSTTTSGPGCATTSRTVTRRCPGRWSDWRWPRRAARGGAGAGPARARQREPDEHARAPPRATGPGRPARSCSRPTCRPAPRVGGGVRPGTQGDPGAAER